MTPIRRRLSEGLVLLAGAAILCLVAVLNGGPLLFPDSGIYIADGENVVHLTTPDNRRPVFYGLAIFFLHWDRTLWLVVFAQGLVVAHIIRATWRALGADLDHGPFLALLFGMAVLTSVSWYVAHIMPDVFSGVLVLSLFLLGVREASTSRLETSYFVLLATACVCFHLSNVALAASLTAAGALLWLFARAIRPALRPSLLAAPLLLGVLVQLLFSFALYHRVALAPQSPPFFLARILEDGPGRDYLRTKCASVQYQLCRYLDRIPATTDPILWEFMTSLPTREINQVRAEQNDIARGTFAMYPGRMAAAMVRNTLAQLVQFASESVFRDEHWKGFQLSFPRLARNVGDTKQLQGKLGPDTMRSVNAVHAAVVVGSLLLGIGLARRCWREGLCRVPALMATVLFALLANAFITGALGAVWPRYQGRIVWILPVAAVAAGGAMIERRRLRFAAEGVVSASLSSARD